MVTVSARRLEAIVAEVTEARIPRTKRFLVFEVSCTDDDDEDVELPTVRYRIPGGAPKRLDDLPPPPPTALRSISGRNLGRG